jgi:DMSO/TMAO reductase YedYZ molybdopterin-dependent catalytic subunit
VNVRFDALRPQGSGPVNRHGMPRLPVGQHEVANWPVLDLGEQPEIGTDAWKLELGGLVENACTLTWDRLLALPQVDDVSDFHCVTTWSRYDNNWRGVRFRTLAELAVPREEARFVVCTGYDFMPGSFIPYTTNLPLERAIEDDVLLVHAWEGRPLPREHGGPCRMITPKLYAWKGTKWIRRIEFTAEDRKGFWEVRGYSNSAEPWFNDRYATQ